MKARAYIDGSGNSGRIQAAAAVLYLFLNGDDSVFERYDRTLLLPRHTTNNVGEYNGAILACQLAKDFGVTDLEILSDSQLIVNQLNGVWRCKEKPLRALRDIAWVEAQEFRSVSIQWIPREENQEADSLVRKAIAEAEKANFRSNNSPNPFARNARN